MLCVGGSHGVEERGCAGLDLRSRVDMSGWVGLVGRMGRDGMMGYARGCMVEVRRRLGDASDGRG